MTTKSRFEPYALKSIPLLKGAILLLMFEWHFHMKVLKNVLKKL